MSDTAKVVDHGQLNDGNDYQISKHDSGAVSVTIIGTDGEQVTINAATLSNLATAADEWYDK